MKKMEFPVVRDGKFMDNEFVHRKRRDKLEWKNIRVGVWEACISQHWYITINIYGVGIFFLEEERRKGGGVHICIHRNGIYYHSSSYAMINIFLDNILTLSHFPLKEKLGNDIMNYIDRKMENADCVSDIIGCDDNIMRLDIDMLLGDLSGMII